MTPLPLNNLGSRSTTVFGRVALACAGRSIC